MKSLEELLADAICIASTSFRNTFDKQGKPYILHCFYVMKQVQYAGLDHMIVGMLHDLIEDCSEWSFELLEERGYPRYILDSLKLLTHDKETPYQEYIENIAKNDIARKVKLADLEHNTKNNRIKGVSEKDMERITKYYLAINYLNNYKK